MIRWLVTTLAVFIAAHIVPGVSYLDWGGLLLAGLLLGILNAFVRPVLMLLSLPWIIVTMGLFILLLNALLLKLVAMIVPGVAVEGFWSAVFGAIVISIVSWPFSCFFRTSDGHLRPITHHPGLKRVEGRTLN